MKLFIPVSLAFALAISAMAQDASSGQSSGSQSQSNPSAQTSPSGQSGQTDQSSQGSQSSQTSQSDQSSMGGKHKQKKMSGKVSSDDKSITTSDNKTYTVDNPDALKGQEGQQVALIVQLDPDTNTVHIIQVAAPTPQQP
ncbi:MAG: hypothetical protein JWN45_1531 [Acidobacteriaceae bacterium]|nr:hypothetical protein [Acidobacteriaceae bacterium]